MADLAHALATPVLPVVGLPPGVPEPCAADRAGNIATLTQLLGSKPLALLPYNADPDADADTLRSAAAQLLATTA